MTPATSPAWMLWAVLVSVAAGLAAAALDRAARALGRPTRAPWVAALLLSAVLPLAAIVRAALPERERAAAATMLPAVVIDAGRDAAASIAGWMPDAAARAWTLALVAWGVVSAALLLRLVLGVRAVRRERASWRACAVDGVDVLVAPDTGPAVVGVARPAIVLPEWMLALDPALRALVLRHEQEHVRAGDAVLRLAGALLTALAPWNPALWWQNRRLALAIEVDCDARVLRADARRERYGLLLLTIAQRQSAAMLAPALSEPTSHLERRITIMQSPKPRHPALVATALAGAAALALAVACTTPAPDASVGPATSVALGPVVVPGAPLAPAPAAAPQAPAAPDAPPKTEEGKPMFEFQVTKPAELAPGNRMPKYPDSLAAGKTGDVLLQLVVERDGSVMPGSLKVLKSSDPAFAEAVRTVIYDWKFTPAEVEGRKVRQVLQLPFTFARER